MSHNDCTRRSLGITDNNIIFDDANSNHYEYIKGNKCLVYDGYLNYQVDRCPNCGFENDLVKNGVKRCLTYIPSNNGWIIYLRLTKQRWLCRRCRSSFSCHTSCVGPNRSISVNTRKMVLKYAKRDLSMTEIGRLTNISPTSVSRIIKETVGEHRYRFQDQLPENLCIDEFRSVQQAMSFIVLDADSHKLVELLSDRRLATIKDYFLSYSLENRLRVRTVTMDLNANYQSIIHMIFPKAKIIIDRFHIVQMLGRNIDRERLNTLTQIEDKRSRTYRILKSQWRIYKKSADKLIADERIYRIHSREFLTDYEILDIGLSCSTKFKETWETYQALLTAIHTQDFVSFKRTIDDYTPLKTDLDVTINTIKLNLKHIENSINYKYSNGPIEGTIRKIKQIKRTGYGYRNMLSLFTRIRLEFA